MKRKTWFLFGLVLFFGLNTLTAQQVNVIESNRVQSIDRINVVEKGVLYASKDKLQTYEITAPDVAALLEEDIEREKNGELYRSGVISSVNYTPAYSGSWTTLENGDKVWQVRIKSMGAQALSVYFDKFVVYGRSYVQVFDINGNPLSYQYDNSENLAHEMQHIPECKSQEIIVQLYEPKGTLPSQISINNIGYVYRGYMEERGAGDSENCHNNTNCPIASNWQDEKRGVARMLIKDGNFQGWCTGSLVNNTAEDCKPYFLTALHCGPTSSAADLNVTKFYFNFEVATCNGTPSEGIANSSNTFTGAIKKGSFNVCWR